MTIKASASFSGLDYDLFNILLECCKKNAEIKYANKQKHNIVGNSVFGGQKKQNGITFQIILKEQPNGIEIYDYSKRGLDRKFTDNLFDLLLPIIGQNVEIKYEDLDECGICKKKFRLGSSRHIPSIGWGTLTELCESCYTLLSNHEKNYCCVCQKKLGIRKYSAKITWNRNLMLCRECYLIQKPRMQNGVSTLGKNNEPITTTRNKSIIIGTDDPLHILKIRFAKGEISKEDYQEMRKLLKDDS